MRNMLARIRNDERGAMGWALLCLLGIPIPIDRVVSGAGLHVTAKS
jgi:hypothetical protein